MRADGVPVKGLSTYARFFPKLMITRTDSQNYVCQYVDMEPLRAYNAVRVGGRVRYMSFIICAYLKALTEHPELNRFVAGKKLYQRKEISVSFVILKGEQGGGNELEQTVVKIRLFPEDDLGAVEEKISEAIRNERLGPNKLDHILNIFSAVPFLLGPFAFCVRWLDRYGLLPAAIVRVSPFHTSLFFSNLTSIGVEHIYHHIYEFGTTSLFASMGRPIRWHPVKGEGHYLPLGIVMDERICSGYEYGRFYRCIERYLGHPEEMDRQSRPAVSAAET